MGDIVNLEKELEDLEIESIKISALDKHYEDFNRGLEAYDNGDHEQAILCFKQITTEIDSELYAKAQLVLGLSLIHISEPTRRHHVSRMPSSA